MCELSVPKSTCGSPTSQRHCPGRGGTKGIIKVEEMGPVSCGISALLEDTAEPPLSVSSLSLSLSTT